MRQSLFMGLRVAVVLMTFGNLVQPIGASAAPPANVNVGVKVNYKGAFRLPLITDPLKASQISIAHDGADGLYFGGQDDKIGRVRIVTPSVPEGGDLSTLPIAPGIEFEPGRVVQPQATRGRVDEQYADAISVSLTGVALDEGRLFVNHGRYYDVVDTDRSGLVSIDVDLAKDTFEGFYAFDFQPAKLMSGSLFAVPSHWELRRSFRFLVGEYWNSDGGGPNTRGINIRNGGEVTSQPVLTYDTSRSVADFTKKDRHPGSFGITVAGTNYYAVTARKASRAWWYGKADPWSDPAAHRNGCKFNAGNPQRNGVSCIDEWNAYGDPLPPLAEGQTALDPCDTAKGYHSASYDSQLYLYNEASLLEALTSNERNIAPITIVLSPYWVSGCGRIAGATTVGNTAYIVEGHADRTQSAYTKLPVIHVFSFENGQGDVLAPAAPRNLRVADVAGE